MVPLEQTRLLLELPVGARFTRYWFAKYGIYTVVAKPEGAIYVEVLAASGRRGCLDNWDRVIEEERT